MIINNKMGYLKDFFTAFIYHCVEQKNNEEEEYYEYHV